MQQLKLTPACIAWVAEAFTNTVTVNLPATVTCVYDLNGNLRTNGNRVLDYDDENQLTAVTVSNAWRSEFVYDGKMRRRIRKEYTWSSGWLKTNEVRYVYDGNLVIQERDANNLGLVTYTRGKDLSGSLEGAGGIGGLLARTANSELLAPSSYYHCDGNGNVTCLVNTNQLLVAKYLYDPFGNTIAMSGPLAEANLYRFSSKEFHPNSGLVYYLYRHYEAGLQRWLNRDPIGELGFESVRNFIPLWLRLHIPPSEVFDTANTFEFVLNNAIGNSDLLGLKSLCDVLLDKVSDAAAAGNKVKYFALLTIYLQLCDKPPGTPLSKTVLEEYHWPRCKVFDPSVNMTPEKTTAAAGAGGILIIIIIIILIPVGA